MDRLRRFEGAVQVAAFSILAVCGMAGLGCSLEVAAWRVQCSVDGDCAQRGAAFAGATCVESVCQPAATWSCLGQPPVVSTQPGPFQVRFHLTDLITQKPKVGVRSSLCHKVDVDCAVPAGMAIGDSSGLVTL